MDLYGIGNALLDASAAVETGFAPRHGYTAGSVSHIEYPKLEKILGSLPHPVLSAGGGALNTIRLAAFLGLESGFCGAVGKDGFGDLIRADLEDAGVRHALAAKDGPTGVFLSTRSGDGRRTVLVAPGAAAELVPADIPDAAFSRGVTLYLDGYMAERESLFRHCMDRGRSAGMKLAFDAASASLVRRKLEFFTSVISEYSPLVFMNEDEAVALLGGPLEHHRLGKMDAEFVVKRAGFGAVYISRDDVVESPVRVQDPYDETGAGDAFAAGFLVGRIRGMAPERCLRLGNRAAGEIIRVPLCAIEKARFASALKTVV
ncbi:MAG: adenosine kinase [Spirochaetes bacterium]|nr:adenosine kinase [Spirochaetota bacterium]